MMANGQGGTAEERRRNASILADEVRELLRHERLDDAHDRFERLHSADQGDLLIELSGETRDKLLGGLPAEGVAEILEHIDPDEAVRIAASLPPDDLAGILDETDADVAAAVLRGIPDERSEQTLDEMTESREVLPLLGYADEAAGGIMNPDFLAVNHKLSANLALDVIRLHAEKAEETGQVFVVDVRGRFEGSVSVVSLALAKDEATVSNLVNPDIVSVEVDTDREECARIMHRYNIHELPVVDADGALRGVILGGDVAYVFKQAATEDMYRLAGVGGENLFGPLSEAVKSRMPWLIVNLATAFLAALAIGLFETTIGRVVALAAMLPLVMSQGAMGGMQTLTLSVRSMALGDLAESQGWRLIAREVALGAAHGALFAALVGAAAYAWKGDILLASALSAAMFGNMIIAGCTGASIPLLLRKLRLDPAVSAAIFITTFTDVLGVILFLGIATALIDAFG